MIMEKSLELFATHGFNATSVQKITEHCGISKGAFYLSFKSKDELIFALIDHFMQQHMTKLDQLVRTYETKNANDLLFEFYQTSYDFFKQHANFTKFFMKDIQTFNEQLIEKLSYYDKLLEKTILILIEKVYGDKVTLSKYDLLYCIKSFMGMYVELILFRDFKLDVNLLSKTLVEKTNILAEHMKAPFITENHVKYLDFRSESITKETLTKLMEEKIVEIEESILKESLTLLKHHMEEEHLPLAIVKGLIENIRKHEDLQWLAYLLEIFFEI